MNVSLNGKWEFYGCDEKGKKLPAGKNTWLPAHVPGDVHLDLIANKLLPDPMEGMNVKKTQAFERHTWKYRKKFLYQRPSVAFKSRLIFEGLDCFAKIYLNGSLLGKTENAFVEHTFDVSAHIISGENTLEIELTNGLETIQRKNLKKYLADAPEYHRIWLRKPQFSFGWDWAPRLIPCGIWRSVRLETTTSGFVDDIFAHPVISRDCTKAIVHCSFNFLAVDSSLNTSYVKLKISDAKQHVVAEKKVSLHAGKGHADMIIEHPDLWWPAGVGEQPLYTLDIIGSDDKSVRSTVRFGVRHVRLVEKEIKKDGSTFAFEINGKILFCRGANWVPADSIPARVTNEKINTLLEEAIECNFNMLRIWGGGIYESDYFYSRCDELGIMLWQDFMYACALYPDDDEQFFNNCVKEAEKVVKRLRVHPSIVLWCGNNEIHDGYFDVYQHRGADRLYGSKLWDDFLPKLIKTHSPGCLYRPASPYGGEYDRSELAGDCHCLRPCLTKDENVDIRLRAQAVGRFLSEFYTWNSPPDMKSISQYLPRDEQHFDSDGYRFHTNTMYDSTELSVVKTFITASPEKLPLDIYIELLQRLHGEHMARLVRTYCRNSKICKGALFWMYNDCWPTSSWTTHDYYLRRKALYYYIKRSFTPLTVSFKEEEGALSVWVSNMEKETFSGSIRYGRYAFTDGKPGKEWTRKVVVKPGQSQKIDFFYTTFTWPFENLSSFAYAVLEDEKGKRQTSASYWLCSYKGMSGEEYQFSPSMWEHKSIQSPQLTIMPSKENSLIITTDVPTFSLRLHADELMPDDNYIDIMPGESRTIKFKKKLCPEKIKTTTLNDLVIFLRQNISQ